jgi:hypothetical protein
VKAGGRAGKASPSKAKVEKYEVRDRAARKIQSCVRMYLANRKWFGLAVHVMFGWRKAGNAIISDLIEEVVVDGLIPDVLIEIFSHAGGRGDPFGENPEVERTSWSIWNMVLEDVVEDLATVVVKKQVHSFVNEYLHRKEEKNNQFDPVQSCAHIVMNDCLQEFINDIVKDSVGRMVEEYLFLQQYEEFLHTALEPIIGGVVQSAQYELDVDNFVDFMLEEFIQETCKDVAEESHEELKDVIFREREAQQFAIISKASERLVETMTLRLLALSLATNGETIIIKDRMQRLLDTLIVRASYSKLRRIEQAEQEMHTNAILRHMHQELTTNIGFEFLLGKLKEELTLQETIIDRKELKSTSQSP